MIPAGLGLGLALALLAAPAQATISINLDVTGGTAELCMDDQMQVIDDCVVASDGDTLEITISATLEGGDAVTLVDPGPQWDAGTLTFDGGTEEAFNFVNGVLLTPIGAAGADIALVEPGRADGWEAQTLDPAGAPGPATFNIGVANFTLTDQGTVIDVDTASAPSFGTVVGGANFVNITDQVTLDEITVLPEASTVASGLAVLGALGLVARRRS